MFTELSSVDAASLRHLTIPLGIRSNGPLVDRSFREALPGMYNREVVQNSLEANATLITICPDWLYVEHCARTAKTPVYRYCCIDNGKGMNESELLSYFHNLSSSGHDLLSSECTNFGMGAKICLLPWNREGLIVMSWSKDNPDGSMIRIVKRDTDSNYGLWLWKDDSGLYQKIVNAPLEYKLRYLPTSETGTILICLGNSATENTFLGPFTGKEDIGLTVNPHLRFINTRFFEIPANTVIKSVLMQVSDKTLWPKSEDPTDPITQQRLYAHKRATGTKYQLDKYCKSSGVLDTVSAKMHWWLIEPDKFEGTNNFYRSNFIGVLFNNELYNLQVGKNARPKYNQFGLLFEEVKKRVVLLIEPKSKDIYPNTARSSLMSSVTENLELPWAQWGSEFINELPVEIKELCDFYASDFEEPRKNTKDRVRDFLARIQPTLLKKASTPQLGADSVFKVYTSLSGNTGNTSKVSCDSLQITPRVVGTVPTTGKKVTPRTETPKVVWVSEKDMLEDIFAAEYVEASNTLKINKNFFLFKEVCDYWLVKYPDFPGAESKIRDAVRDVYQLKLVTVVIHAYTIGSRVEWAGNWKNLITPEALTTAILGIANEHYNLVQRFAGFGVKKI